MNFFKRGTTSIIRRPGKTIILLLLVFILGSVIAGAIAVEGAISNTDANLRRNMQPIVSITDDWEAISNHPFWEEFETWSEEERENFDWDDPRVPRFESLTPEDIRGVGALPYIAEYDYIINGHLRTFELERYTTEEQFWEREPWETIGFNVRGTSSETLIQIDQGIFSLISGEQFNSQHLTPGQEIAPVIVSEGFAFANNLSLGSTFTLSEFVFFPNEDGDDWCWGEECLDRIYQSVDVEFSIVGLINESLSEDADHQAEWDRMDRMNTIFTPNWVIEDFSRRLIAARISMWDATDIEPGEWAFVPDPDEEPFMRVLPLFVLEDPEQFDAFKVAAEAYLARDFLAFQDMSGAFDDIASSMETMQNIANWILYVSIGATLLILSLLITLFLRDRRYEMGVYLALGEKRGKIVTQILLEVVATSFIAITMSVFVGGLISGAVSHNMLMNELQADTGDDWHMGGRWEWTIFDEIGIPEQSFTIDEMMAMYDVSLTPQTIGMFYIVGLGAVVLSTLFPVIYIVTLNPKKVLM